MKKFEKIIDSIEVKNLIIHQLITEAGKRPVTCNQAENLLDVKEKERLFMGRLHKSYHSPRTSPVYGTFGNDDNSFKNLLNSYLEEKDFYSFSVDVMHLYEKKLKATTSASGGFMLLCDYVSKKTSDHYLLVMMMNNKEGYMVTDNLTLDKVKNIDLSKVDVAVLINISRWIRVRDDEDLDVKSYLSFVKGLKKISLYFMSFIDCSDKTTSAESTERLLVAVADYFDFIKASRDDKVKKRKNLYQYCQECLDEKKPILLKRVSYIINPEDPEDFENFAVSETYKVSAIVSGDRTRIRKLNNISYKSNELSISFDCSLLNKTVFFDEDEECLILRELPYELRDKLKRES